MRSSPAEAPELSERSRQPSSVATREVDVTLTADQVIQVCADAGLLGANDPLLDEFANDGRATELHRLLSETKGLPGTAISLSLIRGLLVLSLLPRDGSGVGVVHLAEMLGMAPSSVHRYLTTLVALGLARRAERTREYSRPLRRAH
jgi:hypothetical protein